MESGVPVKDWVWHATSCTELTVEVHEAVEWNDIYAPRLPWLYLEMRDSLLRFITQAHIAIKVKTFIIPSARGHFI